jgi:hypothetical protein
MAMCVDKRLDGEKGNIILRLVEQVSRTQGQVSTTANRMLQSANDVSPSMLLVVNYLN